MRIKIMTIKLLNAKSITKEESPEFETICSATLINV